MKNQLFINGKWVDPVDGPSYSDVINPATEKPFHKIAMGGLNDVEAAVTACKSAIQNGWRNSTGAFRADILRKMADEMERRLDDLARLEVLDNGKPLPEARWDIEDCVGILRMNATLAEELDAKQGTEIELDDDQFRSYVYYEATPIAGLITPWNYPLLMAMMKVAPAIAAGSTILLKPAQVCSLTCLELGDIANAAGLPAGVLNILTGSGSKIGAAIVEHPDIAKISFTGSNPVGSGIAKAGAKNVKNVTLELGGKSPIIVFDDADIDKAVEWVMFGIFWNQGQICSGTSRLLVQNKIADKFLERLEAATKSIVIGDGMDEGVKLGPLVSKEQFDTVMKYIEIGKSEATLLFGGQRPAHLNSGFFVEPVVFSDVPTDARIWKEEIFGPVLAVQRFETEEEAIAEANNSEFGLGAAVIGKDEARNLRIARSFEAGIVWINCSQPAFTEAPWGGMKRSGVGRENGDWGMHNFLETKQVTSYVSEKNWGWYSD